MTALDQLPPMQFALDRVYALKQVCEPVQNDVELTAKPEIDFGWNWRVLGSSAFDVAISVTVKPSQERPDNIIASVVGVFRYLGGEGSGLSFQHFVRENAPAILMPFAREIISSLTARSFYGAFLLPPINVQKALETIIAQGGVGDTQIAGDPQLAIQLGIALPALAEGSSETLPPMNGS